MNRRLTLLLGLFSVTAIVFYFVIVRDDTPPPPEAPPTTQRGKRSHPRPRRRTTIRLGHREVPVGVDRSASASRQGKRIITGQWGDKPGQFGHLEAHESNPEGPMAVAVSPKGNLLLLDQVNGRLQRFAPDGHVLSTIPISTTTAQDVTIDAEGNAIVLDRLGQDPKIYIFDASGQRKGSIPFVGEPVTEPGDVSGVFSDADGIYVEVGHDKVVRIADADGKPVSTRDALPGRPTRDGKLYIKAGMIDQSAGRVYVQAHDKAAKLVWESALAFGGKILHLLLLDSDKTGHVYLGGEVEATPPPEVTYKTVIARLESAHGKLDGQLILPPTTADPTESFRPLTVGDDGTIYQLVETPQGPTLTAYTFK